MLLLILRCNEAGVMGGVAGVMGIVAIKSIIYSYNYLFCN